jgi:hypothetical protein
VVDHDPSTYLAERCPGALHDIGSAVIGGACGVLESEHTAEIARLILWMRRIAAIAPALAFQVHAPLHALLCVPDARWVLIVDANTFITHSIAHGRSGPHVNAASAVYPLLPDGWIMS